MNFCYLMKPFSKCPRINWLKNLFIGQFETLAAGCISFLFLFFFSLFFCFGKNLDNFPDCRIQLAVLFGLFLPPEINIMYNDIKIDCQKIPILNYILFMLFLRRRIEYFNNMSPAMARMYIFEKCLHFRTGAKHIWKAIKV